MKAQVGLLFHANFPFSYHFDQAYHSNYKIVPRILKDYPDLPINLHLAAPLLQMTKWRYPQTIDVIKEGIASEQFEIMGSAYAQNVLYASRDWSNEQHIQVNREVIESILEVQATGFWNPERVWIDSFTTLLTKHGYNHTLIENSILSPEDEDLANTLYYQKVKDKKLYFLPDNQDFQKKIDRAIWTGKVEQVFTYLEEKLDTYPENQIFCYAQDMEVAGFWQVGQGKDPKKAHENLSKLMDAFSENSWVELKHFSAIVESNKADEITHLDDGQASWMVESVRMDGYQDYFDYLKRAPEMHYFDKMFANLEDEIRKHKDESSIYQELLINFLSHQFEYGCAPGSFGSRTTRYLMNVPGKLLLEGARQSLPILRALQRRKEKQVRSPQWVETKNFPQIIWENEQMSTTWTPYGGRCLLLLDFVHDTVLNPALVINRSDNFVSNMDQDDPLVHYPELGQKFQFGGQLFADELQVNGKRQGKVVATDLEFSDKQRHELTSPSMKQAHMDSQILPDGPALWFWSRTRDYWFGKRVELLDKTIRVTYSLENLSQDRLDSLVHTDLELSIHQGQLMNQGQNILEYTYKPGIAAITNTQSRSTVQVCCNASNVEHYFSTSLFAIRQTWKIQNTVEPGSSSECIMELTLGE